MIEMHSKYYNMHENVMFYALIYINNHVLHVNIACCHRRNKVPVGKRPRNQPQKWSGDRRPAQPGMIAGANWEGHKRRPGWAWAHPRVRPHVRPNFRSRV